MIPILSLNHRDARPLHEQVRDGLRHLIIGGAMREDERLPAVRELAATLAINPNTIARAYRDLEGEGYIHTVTGVGTFVSPREDASARRREILLPQWEKLTAELLYLGESIEALTARMGAFTQNARQGGNA